jgi:hypothetical protein
VGGEHLVPWGMQNSHEAAYADSHCPLLAVILNVYSSYVKYSSVKKCILSKTNHKAGMFLCNQINRLRAFDKEEIGEKKTNFAKSGCYRHN